MFKKREIISIRVTKDTPPLTLDQKWHELFAKRKSLHILQLEKKLNALIREQGRINNEYKEYGLLKKKVMGDIITQMPGAFDGEAVGSSDAMDKNKRYIEEINRKLKKHEERLAALPGEIQRANTLLAEASMAVCYKDMMASKKVLDNIDGQIDELRTRLKALIVSKTEHKEQYNSLYSYMHDLLGAEAMQKFDSVFMGEEEND